MYEHDPVTVPAAPQKVSSAMIPMLVVGIRILSARSLTEIASDGVTRCRVGNSVEQLSQLFLARNCELSLKQLGQLLYNEPTSHDLLRTSCLLIA